MYFSEKSVAYAIKVAKVMRYDEPKLIQSLTPSSRPPQSFMYIKE